MPLSESDHGTRREKDSYSRHTGADLAEFVTIEKGLGPEGRIAVVRFDRGDGINALSPEALRQLTEAARSFEDESDTSVVVLTGGPKAVSAGFDLKDPEGRSRKNHGHRFVAPAPEARTAADPRLAGDGANHHRRHRRVLHWWRRGSGGGARLSRHEPRRASTGARDRARHEHELAEHPAHAAPDRTGADQAGSDPGRPAHLGGGSLRMGSGGGGGRSRPRFRRGDDTGRKNRGAAAAIGRHDEIDRQSPGARAR